MFLSNMLRPITQLLDTIRIIALSCSKVVNDPDKPILLSVHDHTQRLIMIVTDLFNYLYPPSSLISIHYCNLNLYHRIVKNIVFEQTYFFYQIITGYWIDDVCQLSKSVECAICFLNNEVLWLLSFGLKG